jgi:hypothetical protein
VLKKSNLIVKNNYKFIKNKEIYKKMAKNKKMQKF